MIFLVYIIITLGSGAKNYNECDFNKSNRITSGECKTLAVVSAPFWPVKAVSEIVKLIDKKGDTIESKIH